MPLMIPVGVRDAKDQAAAAFDSVEKFLRETAAQQMPKGAVVDSIRNSIVLRAARRKICAL